MFFFFFLSGHMYINQLLYYDSNVCRFSFLLLIKTTAGRIDFMTIRDKDYLFNLPTLTDRFEFGLDH